MSLSNDLLSQFAKITKDDKKKKNEATVYGTIKEFNNKLYVKIDGSEILTPTSTTADMKIGERVMVQIKDHSATIIGNISSPAARTDDVESIKYDISNALTADEADIRYAAIDSLDVITADVEDLKTDKLDAATAKVTYATIKELDATNATIKELTTDALTAEKADIRYATIGSLDAAVADIELLETNKLDAATADIKYATIDSLNSATANIEELIADKLDAESANLKYANIDFSNIGMAAVEKLFAKSGIIKDLVVDDTTITGELVGVTIKGDLIEGNTIVADKLVVQGEDGIYYKLNTDGIKVEAEQTDYNSINGSIITAKSITATKIAVEDLVAFDATIGGFNITENSIYSGAKSSATNTTRGVFFGDDGQLAVGDSTNFLKYYKDQNGNYKLEISAGSMILSSSNKNIETTLNELSNKTTTNSTNLANYISSNNANVDSLTERVSTAETTISKNSEEIDLRAKKTEVESTYATKTALNTTNANVTAAQNTANSAVTKAENAQADVDGLEEDLTTLTNRVSTAETNISQNSDAIKLKAEKTEVTTAIATAKSEAISTAASDATTKANNALSSANSNTSNLLKNYSNTTEMNAAIDLKAEGITSSVSSTYATKTELTDTQNDLDSVTGRVSTAESNINQISNKVSINITDIDDLGTRMSAVEITSSDFSVRLGDVETNLGNIDPSSSIVAGTVMGFNGDTIPEGYEEVEVDNVTNYMNFSSSGLVIGDMQADVLGNNVLIGNNNVDIRSGSTTLASFRANNIYLGKNSETSIIDLCNGSATMRVIDDTDFRIYTDKRLVMKAYDSMLLDCWRDATHMTRIAIQSSDPDDTTRVGGVQFTIYQDDIQNTVQMLGNDIIHKVTNGTSTTYTTMHESIYKVDTTGNIVLNSKSSIQIGDSSSYAFGIRLGSTFTKAKSINCYWVDGEIHDLVNQSTNGQTCYFGAADIGEVTNTNVRGKYVRLYAHSGGGVYLGASGSTAITSDRNMKKDIVDIDDKYINFFDKLRPITYKYNDGHRDHIGFIAQEVEEALTASGLTTEQFAGLVIEEDVTLNPNYDSSLSNKENAANEKHYDKLYSLRYEEFISLLVKKVQNLQKQIDELKGE